MVEHQFEYLPEGLAELPVGAVLAAALAAVDPGAVAPADLAVLLAAARRQLSADEARFARCARELALADVSEPSGRGEVLGEFAADEVRAVLSISRTAAWRLIGRAEDTAVRLPALGAAWQRGEIDADRVRAFCTWTDGLSDVHARRVVEVVLPEAPRLMQSGLVNRIREVAIALDPEWAQRLYENSVRQRRLRARTTEAGTANLSGLDLPLDAAARSVARVNAMAAHAKALGHPGLIDTVRADVFLALLSPHLAGADDDAVIDAVLAAARPDDPADRPPPDPDDAPPDDPAPAGGTQPQRAHRRVPRQARFELRVGLATLLGRDERPARLPGWGAVHAELARQLARDHCDGEWRVAVTDHRRALTAALVTRLRPHGYRTTPPEAPAGTIVGARPVVQIHVTEDALDRLDPADHPEWVRVITDLQHQLCLWREARAAEGEPDADAARRARARFPDAALARWVEMRDQQCVFPPCGAPAKACDLDHTLAFVAERGLTEAGNLGPMCCHDHLMKHGSRWRLEQPEPGRFLWTSPTGHRYANRPDGAPVDLPEPRPPEAPAQRSSVHPSAYADTGPVWDDEPYPAADAAGPPADRAPPETVDDEPPF